MKLYKHLFDKHGVEIDGKIYRPNRKGELYLPVIDERYNPVEKKKKSEKSEK